MLRCDAALSLATTDVRKLDDKHRVPVRCKRNAGLRNGIAAESNLDDGIGTAAPDADTRHRCSKEAGVEPSLVVGDVHRGIGQSVRNRVAFNRGLGRHLRRELKKDA